MDKMFFALALLVLLAFSPASVFAARTLWVTVDATAMVVDEGSGEEGTPVYQFQSSGKVLNAAKVSVEDMNGETTMYLLSVYDGDSGMVVDDPDSATAFLPFGSGSDSGSGSGSGAGATADHLAFYLPDIYDQGSDGLTVTLELGHLDWAAVADAYENDPSAVSAAFDSFERLAFATSTIGDLQTAYNISPLASTAEAGQTAWKPSQFTAVPEPATVWTALLGIALLARRRKPAADRG